MKVHGYTDQRDEVAIDLAVGEIVASGLHPWSLDLFDPDPIILTVEGEKLRFSRLRDISFAYQLDSGEKQELVALHDGQKTACLTGTVSAYDSGYVHVEQVRVSDRSFQDHLSEYLQHGLTMDLFKSRASMLFIGAPTGVGIRKPTLPLAYLPNDSGGVTLQAKTVTYRTSTTPFAHRLGGRTDELLPVQATLPYSVIWSLRVLGSLGVIVIGRALRQVLEGKQPKEINLIVKPDKMTDARNLLKSVLGVRIEKEEDLTLSTYLQRGSLFMMTGLSRLEFTYDDCRYVLQPSESPLFWLQQHANSANNLYCEKPGRVMVSRIGLYDLGKRQSRRLYPLDSPLSEDRDGEELKESGFSLLTVKEITRGELIFGPEQGRKSLLVNGRRQ